MSYEFWSLPTKFNIGSLWKALSLFCFYFKNYSIFSPHLTQLLFYCWSSVMSCLITSSHVSILLRYSRIMFFLFLFFVADPLIMLIMLFQEAYCLGWVVPFQFYLSIFSLANLNHPPQGHPLLSIDWRAAGIFCTTCRTPLGTFLFVIYGSICGRHLLAYLSFFWRCKEHLSLLKICYVY